MLRKRICVWSLALSGCAAAPHAATPVTPVTPLTKASQPDAAHPVVAVARVDPDPCAAGRCAQVVIAVQIAPGWHIYPLGPAVGPEVPTLLRAASPPASGTQWVSDDWHVAGDGAGSVYEGEVVFSRPLRLAPDSRGRLTIPIQLTYEACDAFSCRAPVTAPLSATVQVTAPR
jgi:DsbC/DsbD-like thiol-disulfide interchange protein